MVFAYVGADLRCEQNTKVPRFARDDKPFLLMLIRETLDLRSVIFQLAVQSCFTDAKKARGL
jgi:hypothetical protein